MGVQEKQIYRGKLPKKGGHGQSACRLKEGGGGLAKKGWCFFFWGGGG